MLSLILVICYCVFLGLLSTEAGTIGRVVGDMAITLASTILGSSAVVGMNRSTDQSFWNLVNALYLPIGIGVIVSVLLVNHYSSRLDPVTIK